ncbi:MAG TPA: chemotaxis protein CheD [Spirochaetota bacterium]|nr:chemotaxis protein CheD [Spirochaetota bacterium]HPI22783.1 chemotaxis protein CheD [Spirochaetota bacterium]HPU90188.1 chemotaxis protein CheD [Spirochaetota bacterium]
MIKKTDSQFNKPLYILYPGEFYATKEDCVISTVLGSCMAVCLFDVAKRIGGMGIFIVPGTIGTSGIISDAIASKGIGDIELLLGEIVKIGGDRRYLKAKIFGAGYPADSSSQMEQVMNSNIKFIYEYFTLENMTVERSDLGGEFRRRLYFFPWTGKVYRNILQNNEESSEFIKLEQEYIDSEFRQKEKFGRVILFD